MEIGVFVCGFESHNGIVGYFGVIESLEEENLVYALVRRFEGERVGEVFLRLPLVFTGSSGRNAEAVGVGTPPAGLTGGFEAKLGTGMTKQRMLR